MKFSIRKRSEIIKKAAFGSALLMVSAFAVFNPVCINSQSELSHEKPTPKSDKSDEKVAKEDSVLTARSVFERLHSSALEVLPATIRLDMLDYWDVDSVYKASNAMQGLSWLETVTPDYLKVHVTGVSTLEIKILPEKKGKVVLTVNTIGDDPQALDSQLSFYNENLEPLPLEKFITMPAVKDFFEIPKGSTTKMKELEQLIPFPTVEFNANPKNDNLEASLTVEKFIDEDDWNIAKIFLKPNVTFKWEKGKFKLMK